MKDSSRSEPRRRVGNAQYRTFGMLGVIVLLVTAVAIKNSHFLELNNLKVILMDTSILGIAAIAQLIVMLTANIDVSSSSVIAVSGFTSALLMKTYPELSPIVVIILAMLMGLVMGSVNGVIIAYGEVPAIIVTLGMLSILRGVNYLISGGGWVVSRDLPDSFRLISNGTALLVPNIIVFLVAVVLIFAFLLRRTKPGRLLYVVGSSKVNARLLGIDTRFITFAVFAVAGTLFGLSGVLWVSRFNFAQSNTAAGFELTVIAAAVVGGTSVVGGKGSVTGVLLGAFLLSFIINAINVVKISPFWKMAIQGMIILMAVIVDSWLMRQEKAR